MHSKRPNFMVALGVLLAVALSLVWLIISLTNGDLLWFLPVFNTKADWLVVYWDEQTYMLFPGDAGYDEIMRSFSVAVADWGGYEGSVGLSDENLERYRNEWRLLELHYNTPVQVHTPHLYSKARNFFIPLSGTHAMWRRVFAGLTDKPRIGVLNVNEAHFESLLEAVEQMVLERPGADE